MMLFKIASRSIFRNTRRSLTTMLTIAIGTAATLIFGAYTTFVFYGIETSTVERLGHLTVYRQGYFDFGSGNPAIWGIAHYETVLQQISSDPVLSSLTVIATPVQSLAGIVESSASDESRTFLGTGFVPADRDLMKHWDEHGTALLRANGTDFDAADSSQGIVGVGLARILGLCAPLKLGNCPKLPTGAPSDKAASADVAALPSQNFSDLVARDTADDPATANKYARIDLLAATAGGAPNVVNLAVRHAEPQGVRELDDAYVGMQLPLAQQLVYGRGEHRVTGIVLQLHRTEDMQQARRRLAEIFASRHLDLEVRDFAELNPFYTQVVNLFGGIFSFIAVIIGVVVLFTVSNAMGMSVVERTDEIGTTRALGVRRSGIRRQFLLEGAMLGFLGATVGVILALAAAYFVNRAGISYVPPAQAEPVPLRLYMFGAPLFIVKVWLTLIVVATLAALLPANRAAKLQIVDALRHV
ncbi:MAG: ABC transporter permease [Proteobacteria bacterium]|nr:ABC transporter permease [Pseudomonadota bacterium]